MRTELRIAFVALIGCMLMVGCGSETKPEKDSGTGTATHNTSKESGATKFAAAQKLLDDIKSKYEGLTRLTLHAIPADGSECTQIASTDPARRGKPSDPEDIRAMNSGEEVVLDEDGALDVTVPLMVKDGKAKAVTGVTLAIGDGTSREDLIAEARTIAKAFEEALQAAGKALW